LLRTIGLSAFNQDDRLVNSSSQNRHAHGRDDSAGATFEGHSLTRTQHPPATRCDGFGAHVEQNAVISQNDGGTITVERGHGRLHGAEP